jgi:HPt (histidine-containing phosphotransfer) domain-containing protein
MTELRELGRALGRDVLRELAESFRSQTCLEGIRSGLAQGDLPLVEREAHTLKGSSAALGAMRLADLCAKLEHQPPETPEGYLPRVAAIEEEYRRVLEGLTAASGGAG